MDYKTAIEYIYSRQKFGMKLGLENISNLLRQSNNPHKKFQSIHIAGTNGKGSTSAIIATILQAAGYKVGIYTSPHLVEFRERIRINNDLIPEKEITRILEKIKPLITNQTYFEVVTTIAFKYFEEQKIDYAIIEVGLGGRLDATNVIIPEVSVITNISLEHIEHLGDTIEKIAFEKAGIIKENIPVIVLENCAGLKVIEKIATERNSNIIKVKKTDKEISLLGNYQKENAGLALACINLIDKNISEQTINSSLKQVYWPGRLQKIEDNMILDCAHNVEAIKLLVKEIKKQSYKKLIVVIGIMNDKNKETMIESIDTIADTLILTKAKIDRSATPEILSEFTINNKKNEVHIIGNIFDAIEFAKLKATKKDLILITGSIFVVGEAFLSLGLKPFNSKIN